MTTPSGNSRLALAGILRLTLAGLLSLSAAGCGGGSSGTGGRELDGFVLKGTEPLTDVTITTLPPSDTSMTDQSGHFALHDLPYEDTVHLRFASPSSVILVDIVGIPPETESIAMHCDYNEATGQFAVSSTEFTAEDGSMASGTSVVVSIVEE